MSADPVAGAGAAPARVREQAPLALWRRAVAELLGTALLVAVVVGSGIAAARLSPNDAGLQLLENALATALGLAVLIAMFQPVSGASFNPVVTLVEELVGERRGRVIATYLPTQVLGAILGAVLANLMFGLPAVTISTTERASAPTVLAEVVATAGLVLVIRLLAGHGRAAWIPKAVGAYIGAAYWFTSSTSFANPAVTLGRIFSDSFAGIAPGAVPWFLGAQLLGGALGWALGAVLMPKR